VATVGFSLADLMRHFSDLGKASLESCLKKELNCDDLPDGVTASYVTTLILDFLQDCTDNPE
jgi:hypothetical protein